MITTVKEALELEELENQIEKSEENLEKLTQAYQAYLKKITSYIQEYISKIASFTDTMNKEIDSLYSGIDAFEAYNHQASAEIDSYKKDLTSLEAKQENKEALELCLELKKKMNSEIQSITNACDYSIQEMLKEYKKVSERLSKLSERLSKLKTKDIIR